MISIEQMKAARSLLNWNQQVLASAAGISKTALANIERRSTSPRTENLASIKRALEEGGVEFIDGPGVRLKGDILQVQVFKGNDSINRLWMDIYQTLNKGGERLIYGVDDKRYTKLLGKKVESMMAKYAKRGITGRVIAANGDTYFADKNSEYRWLDNSLLCDIPFYVYADKYALLIWEPQPRVVLVENKAIADTFRKQFNNDWERSKIPEKQTIPAP